MKVSYDVGTNLIYAAIQEFGGEIYPKNSPYLIFQVDGEWVYATKVRIPAHPYLRPAFDVMSPIAVARVGAVFEKLVLAKHYGG